MKNKEFHKLLKKNKSNANSGFTLTELLVGLIMSIFVIGALGFGLLQILRFTQKGNSETLVRNDSSRALDFISDEMRRAQAIEVDMETGVGKNINLVAPDYSLPTGGTVRLALQLPQVAQRVIYSVAPPDSTSPWKGPRVIYRWGPVLGADGNYTAASLADPATWENEALVDGISDVDQTVACDNDGDGTDETITYKGFFACVVDDDGDVTLNAAGNPVKENVTDNNGDGIISFADDPKDKNGDGEINFGDTLTDTNSDGDITFADSALDINGDGKIDADDGADTDGIAITAQLYFSGQTKDADGISTGTYSADSKAVVRSRTAPDGNADDFNGYITSFRTLDPSFGCNSTNEWTMRTDFGSSISNPSDIDNWEHEDDRQPRPIVVNSDTLVISSIPRNISSSVDCLNSRNGNGHGGTGTQDFAGNKDLGASDDWHTDSDNNIVAISHTINFNDPRTFNGNLKDCSGSSCDSPNGKVLNDSDGSTNQYVIMLKNGSTVPPYQPYDVNGDGNIVISDGDQVSLGEFLKDKGLATGDEDSGYTIKPNAIGDDERIIAFEVGKDNVSDLSVPGVDFQDNIFVLQSDAFAQEYSTYTEGDGTSTSYAVPYPES